MSLFLLLLLWFRHLKFPALTNVTGFKLLSPHQQRSAHILHLWIGHSQMLCKQTTPEWLQYVYLQLLLFCFLPFQLVCITDTFPWKWLIISTLMSQTLYMLNIYLIEWLCNPQMPNIGFAYGRDLIMLSKWIIFLYAMYSCRSKSFKGKGQKSWKQQEFTPTHLHGLD